MSTTQGPEAIDVSQLQNDNAEAIEMNGAANAFARSTPIKDSRYRANLQPPSNAEDAKKLIVRRIFQSGDNAGKPWYQVHYEVFAAEYFDPKMNSQELLGKSRKFSKTASTMIRHVDGTPTCEIASILNALGYDIKGKVTQEELVKHFVDALTRKPQVGAISEVSARYDSGEPMLDFKTNEPLKDENGKVKTTWKTLYRAEKNFPKNPDGSVNYELPPVQLAGGKTANPFVSADIVDFFRLT